MKAVLCISLLLSLSYCSYSQDSIQLKQIDSIVHFIKTASLKHQADTINQDKPAYGYFGFSIVTLSTDGDAIKRYINHVEATIKRQDKTEKMVGENIFYFNNDELIKVEESATGKGKTMSYSWYFSGSRSLNTPVISDKGEDRAALLLQIAKGILVQAGKK
jgi:hypothetical protein